MSAPEYVPEEFRGSDLQSAYLEGLEEGRVWQRSASARAFGALPHPNYCSEEWRAHGEGFQAAVRESKKEGTA